MKISGANLSGANSDVGRATICVSIPSGDDIKLRLIFLFAALAAMLALVEPGFAQAGQVSEFHAR